jgi:1-aminocyclopropane-1-carboxylate deaminase/D-cysteine desulfhydrase-like pyridoxal-dependent ACC family enzyme
VPYRDDTPIEEHVLRGRRIFVKRDDLYGSSPSPPLAKLRGLRRVLDRAYTGGTRLVGCWDTRVSKLGLGVAVACVEHEGLRCVLAFPQRKGESAPQPLLDACAFGAELLPLKPNHVDIGVAQARKVVTARGGVMLPFGLDCQDAVEAVATEARRTPLKYIDGGTLVVCCGSGVTLAGLIIGMSSWPARIVGVSSGRSIARISRCVTNHVRQLPANVELVPASAPYATLSSWPCPFPAHPNYDRKVWRYLDEHLDECVDPIMFWNIGA